MLKCMFTVKIAGKEIQLEGIVHAWSTDYEELNNGIGHFAVGVVQAIKDGQCYLIHVNSIKIIS